VIAQWISAKNPSGNSTSCYKVNVDYTGPAKKHKFGEVLGMNSASPNEFSPKTSPVTDADKSASAGKAKNNAKNNPKGGGGKSSGGKSSGKSNANINDDSQRISSGEEGGNRSPMSSVSFELSKGKTIQLESPVGEDGNAGNPSRNENAGNQTNTNPPRKYGTPAKTPPAMYTAKLKSDGNPSEPAKQCAHQSAHLNHLPATTLATSESGIAAVKDEKEEQKIEKQQLKNVQKEQNEMYFDLVREADEIPEAGVATDLGKSTRIDKRKSSAAASQTFDSYNWENAAWAASGE
jgi:hypothetical protein